MSSAAATRTSPEPTASHSMKIRLGGSVGPRAFGRAIRGGGLDGGMRAVLAAVLEELGPLVPLVAAPVTLNTAFRLHP
jgi:hypothetical protein